MPRVLFTIFWVSLLGVGVPFLHAQTVQKEEDAASSASEEQLKADLPEVIRAQIIDTTRIVLEPRRRFNDSSKPKLIGALGLYAKEHLWSLPPILTPQKVDRPEPAQPKNYVVNLTAYPSLPESLFYRVLFAGHSNETRGFLRLNREQLGNKRTEGRGDYTVDGVRGGLSYQYRPLSEISLDLGLNLKDLEWLSATADDQKFRKDLLFFHSDLNWKGQISETGWTTLNFDTEFLRLTDDQSGQSEDGTDLRFNFDIAALWPFLNPIHAGAGVEYFSVIDDQTILRLYVRDQFSPFGPFVLSMGAEAASLRERDDTGADGTRFLPNPYLAVTTDLGDRWIFQMEGLRTIHRSKLSTLYFDSDFISLNPSLRPEKTWKSQILLKYHRGRKFEANLSGFAKQIDDLVVLDKVATNGLGGTLTWTPKNIEARIYGGQLDVSVHLTNRLDLEVQYVHEFHDPQQVEQIAYRPEDLVNLEVVFHLPMDFRLELGGEFRGERHVDGTTDLTQESYVLLKPKLSTTIGAYVDAFIGGAFAIGEYALLEGYELSQDNVDFGIELRF